MLRCRRLSMRRRLAARSKCAVSKMLYRRLHSAGIAYLSRMRENFWIL